MFYYIPNVYPLEGRFTLHSPLFESPFFIYPLEGWFTLFEIDSPYKRSEWKGEYRVNHPSKGEWKFVKYILAIRIWSASKFHYIKQELLAKTVFCESSFKLPFTFFFKDEWVYFRKEASPFRKIWTDSHSRNGFTLIHLFWRTNIKRVNEKISLNSINRP